MTTPGDLPPHEARGGLGNIMDPGGGGNTLKPSPLPNALTGGGPGLSTAAASMPGGPTVAGVDDPQAVALLIAKLAGEWFGPSLAPTPSASSGWTSAGLSPPISPGIAPAALGPASTIAPTIGPASTGMAGSPAGSPHDSASTAVPQHQQAPHQSAFAPSLAPAPAPAPASPPPPPSASASGWDGAPPSPSHGRGTHQRGTHQPSPSAAAPTSGHGTDAPGKSGVSSTSLPASSRSGGESRTGGASTSERSRSSSGHHDAKPSNPANPFDVALDLSSLDGGMPFADLRLPVFGSSDLGASTLPAIEGSRFDAPRFDAPRFDAPSVPRFDAPSAPRFDAPSVPGFDAPRVDPPSAPGFDVPHTSSFDTRAPLHLDTPYEVHSTDDPAIRELGGVAFDPYRVRRDFPILEERVRGKRLVWLDNAATTQKPRVVIERLSEFYEHENSNIHRAAHTLAARATDAYEKARETTRKFLNAPSTSEIIFVRGATEGINLVAQSWGRKNITAGDEIVLTHLEHHANIVPWQQLCSEKGARLRVAPVDDRGDVILEEYEKLLSTKTKLVALPQVSNALGTITPARQMVEMAHRYGARVLVDGAQAVSHMKVDVQLLDCDFYVFSGHKVFAPTGIGAVFGKRELLDTMPPWQGGGNMIQDVTFERTTYQPAPFRFEAGTGNIADAAGLGTALDYIMQIGLDTIDRYEHELLVYATHHLARVPGLRMIGTSPNKASVLSFTLEGQRTEDVGAALDQEGIAVRSGHHCAQPILRRFGVEATVRASLAFYNVREDVDALVDALVRLQAGHARRS